MKRLLVLGVGWSCLFIGLIGGLLPILQGWPFGIAGLLILSREYEWAHNLTQKLRTRFPKFAKIMDTTAEKANRIARRFAGKEAA